jgi:hypothetical protein
MPWILLAVVLWVVGLLAVPQESFRRLMPFGIIAGFGLALLVNILCSSVLGLWRFTSLSWPILGVPFWIFLAWVPSVIIFVHFLPGDSLARLGWLLAFPAIYTAVEFLYLRAGLRIFSSHWNLMAAFLLSLGLHIFILAYYLISVRSPEATVSAGGSQRPRP